MRLLVLQVEDRRDPLTDRLMEHNQRVCAAHHGVRYVRRTQGWEDRPPYWRKVFALAELMAAHRHEVEFALWLDSDALFAQYDTMGPLDVPARWPGFAMWLSPDAPPRYGAPFCAGVFLLRNDRLGRRLVRTWRGMYRPDRWSRDDGGRWTCAGGFAGPDYEQGAFIDRILRAPAWAPHLCVLPYHVFNAVDCAHLHGDTVTVHLAGAYKTDYGGVCTQHTLREPPRRRRGRAPAPTTPRVAATTVALVVLCCVWLAVRWRRPRRRS